MWSLQDWVQIFGKGRLKVSWFLRGMGREKTELIPSLIQIYYAHYSRNLNTWLHCWMTLVEFFTSCLWEKSSILWTEIWFFFFFLFLPQSWSCLLFFLLITFSSFFLHFSVFFIMELILCLYAVCFPLGLLHPAFCLIPSRWIIFLG